VPPLPRRRFDILLIEDNEADVGLTTAAFRDALVDAHVHVARDGEEAMVLLGGEHAIRPDLVTLDLGLPRGDGFDVVEAMKADAKLKLIPVIIMSGSDRPEDRARAYRLQAVRLHRQASRQGQVLRRDPFSQGTLVPYHHASTRGKRCRNLMSPSNEHELEIARAVDKFALDVRPSATHGIIDELPTKIVLKSGNGLLGEVDPQADGSPDCEVGRTLLGTGYSLPSSESLMVWSTAGTLVGG